MFLALVYCLKGIWLHPQRMNLMTIEGLMATATEMEELMATAMVTAIDGSTAMEG